MGNKPCNKTSSALGNLTQPNTLFRQDRSEPLKGEAGEKKKKERKPVWYDGKGNEEETGNDMKAGVPAFLTEVCLIISRAVAFSFLCLVNICP